MATADASKRQLSMMIGPVVYFIRTRDGLIKVGWTSNLEHRKSCFGGWDCVLAFYRGTLDDEAREHDRLAEHRVRGAEFYRPHPDVLAAINAIRATLGVPPVKDAAA